MKIKIGIVGYGNLGKGVETAISQNPDMELVAIFSRRNLKASEKFHSMKEIEDFQDKIDVMILCGGSAKDLPIQILEISRYFNTVDSFDNHGKIPEYFSTVDRNAKKNHTLSLISTGWDPGLFSMMRLLGEVVLPNGKTHTFWGKGLSQGHSDAIRRVPGVKMGAQYTIPDEEALERIRKGDESDFKAFEMHRRICYVVLKKNSDAEEVETSIKTMPDYFEPYQTEVHFIDESEFMKNHTSMPHGGRVLRTGKSGSGHLQHLEFSLALESNPEFTSSVLVAFARAVYRMGEKGNFGAISAFDIPLGFLSPKSPKELRKEIL